MSDMAKAGDTYRELVGLVMAALDPGSVVKTEQWIMGPDGERDMDVEVRGSLNGLPHFVLVECKDHARPIGIGFVDAFESKIRDLRPDRAVMFSNSGFTRDALRKANRVGIEVASALKAKDKTIKIKVHREVIARRLTLSFRRMVAYPFDGCPPELEDNWDVHHLLFDGQPVLHWVRKKMTDLASADCGCTDIIYMCTFRHEERWTYREKAMMIGGLKLYFECKQDWVSQTVETDVSLGYYDYSKRTVVVPDKHWYALNLIDNNAWEETDRHWDDSEMKPNTFRLNLTIFRSNLPNAPDATPGVDELIAEQKVVPECAGG